VSAIALKTCVEDSVIVVPPKTVTVLSELKAMAFGVSSDSVVAAYRLRPPIVLKVVAAVLA
jgi:hypothetical protein